MLTPIPWKILDETAKWSQNWSWTPVPRTGIINFKYTTCTLCPMACGVRVRCIGNQPVSLMGIPNHPISGGGLCAIGLGGHLLPYHPSRLKQPCKILKAKDGIRSIPVSYEESISAVVEAVSSSSQGSVAILDGQPKRTISFVYRRFLAGLANGTYVTPPTNRGIPIQITENVLGKKGVSLGFDIENTRTILSFGTPVLDGWGTPGQSSSNASLREKILKDRSGKDKPRLIQVESLCSRTARLADEWTPVKPGTEAAFALALANVIIDEKLCDTQKLQAHSTDFRNGSGYSFADLTKKFPPSSVSERTGIPGDKIISIARELASMKPSLVVFGGNPGAGPFNENEQIIFMDLNILLGSVGTKGGLITRNELPDPFAGNSINNKKEFAVETSLVNVPDHSIKVLIMDGAESGNIFPWKILEQKLVPNNPVVVSLSPYFAGFARHADYLIPSPAYLETFGDSPTPTGSATASYAVSTPILTPPPSVVEPLNVIKRIAAHSKFGNEIQSFEMQSLLKNRIRKIVKESEGTVFDAPTGKTVKLASISSTERVMESLSNGGCWTSTQSTSHDFHKVSLLGGDHHGFERLMNSANRNYENSEIVLLPYATSLGQPHQLMTKLYRESALREPANLASINPETGKRMNLIDGNEAVVKTESGVSKVKIKFDKAIMPGVIQVAVGPAADRNDPAGTHDDNILEICPVNDDSNVGMAQGAHKIENDSTWRITRAEILPA